MKYTTDQQASTYGGGASELSAYVKADGRGGTSIDWEGAAKKGAGMGAAAVCTAYGAAAAAPVCAMVGSAVAGALISGAKGLGASGTSKAELARMAAEDDLIFLGHTQHAQLTPLLWRTLQTLKLYAEDMGKKPTYAALVSLLAGFMRQRLPAASTIWKVTHEHLIRKGTCPPPKPGPAPTPAQCMLPPIREWAEYDGRPVSSTRATPKRIQEPWPSVSWATIGTGRFVRFVEGSGGVPGNALLSPMPPFVAPGLDQFGTGTKAAVGFSAMETWARVLAEAAVKTAGLFDKPSFQLMGGLGTVSIKPELTAVAGAVPKKAPAPAGKVVLYAIGGAVTGGAIAAGVSPKEDRIRNGAIGAVVAGLVAGVVARD